MGELLLDPSVLKIVHAGGQDMEILASRLGRLPAPVYDTQIAAAFAGHSLQMGYGALVQALLNIRLAKDEGFADWSRRPLTPAMRDYAENDVRYLHAIHDRLSRQLERKGRAAWAQEQMDRTLTQAAEDTPAEELWRKVGGKNVLDGQGLAILRELAKWRDEEARRRDKPRRSVVKDDLLIEVARRGATEPSVILGLRTAPQNLGERAATGIAEAVKRGKDVPREARPELESIAPLDEHGAVLLELMSAVVRLKAMEENLPPALLANGDDLRSLAAERSRPDVSGPLFSGWRGELIGGPLRDLIAGNLVLGYDTRRRKVTLARAPSAAGE